MRILNADLKKVLREEALEEVHKAYPKVCMPASFEEALVCLENGKVEETKVFLFFYTIYSEKCDELAQKITDTQSKEEDILKFSEEFIDTRKFLKQKLSDWMK